MSNIINGINEASSAEVTELLRYIMANSRRAFDYYEQLEELFDNDLVREIEIDNILLNDDLKTDKLKSIEVIKPIVNRLLSSIKPEGKQYLPLLRKLSDEWANMISPHLDRYIERNFKVKEGQIYSTGGGAGQSYRKFVPKSSNESLIMKGIQRESKKGKQVFDEITQNIIDMIWNSNQDEYLRYLVYNPDSGIELDTNQLDDALEYAEEFSHHHPDSPTLVYDRTTMHPVTGFNIMHEGYSAGASGGAGLGENDSKTDKKVMYVIMLRGKPIVQMSDYYAIKDIFDHVKGKNPRLDVKLVQKKVDMSESFKNDYKKLLEFFDSGDNGGGDDGEDFDDISQQVIEMYFEDGLKEQEIAEIVGISELRVNQIIDDYERGVR